MWSQQQITQLFLFPWVPTCITVVPPLSHSHVFQSDLVLCTQGSVSPCLSWLLFWYGWLSLSLPSAPVPCSCVFANSASSAVSDLSCSWPLALWPLTSPMLLSLPFALPLDVPMYVTFPIQEVESTSLFALHNLIFLHLLTHLLPIFWRSCWEEPASNTCCQTFPYGFTALFYKVHAA